MGPLTGLNVVEMAGLGPAPFAGMMLADMGADVLRIDRKASGGATRSSGVKAPNFIDRGRRSVAHRPQAPARARRWRSISSPAPTSVIEGFRPGRDGAARARARGLPRAQSQASSTAA